MMINPVLMCQSMPQKSKTKRRKRKSQQPQNWKIVKKRKKIKNLQGCGSSKTPRLQSRSWSKVVARPPLMSKERHSRNSLTNHKHYQTTQFYFLTKANCVSLSITRVSSPIKHLPRPGQVCLGLSTRPKLTFCQRPIKMLIKNFLRKRNQESQPFPTTYEAVHNHRPLQQWCVKV